MQPTPIRNTSSLKPTFAFLHLLVAFSCQVPIGRSQSLGRFTPTGSMTMPRIFHTATLLADGRVLVAGGSYGLIVGTTESAFTNSAELFDPSTGTFSPTGPMTSIKAWHTATLLADRKVLIAGSGFSNSAELFNPSTGTFTALGNMAAGHSFATLLNTGRVLMSGGPSSANAEVYDLATGAFTAAADYATPAALVTATVLADGRVLLTGCKPNCSDSYSYIAQLYDPATDTFSLTGSTGTALPNGQTETSLPNGKVLFAGGSDEDGSPYSNAYLYDPSSAAFTPTRSMTKARYTHTATLLPDGTVLIAGGGLDLDAPGSPCCVGIQTAESYYPITETFGSATNMIAARSYHTATLLNDGRVLLAGGVSLDSRSQRLQPPNILASAEIYTPPKLIPAPALLSLAGDGRGQGAIWHSQTGQIASDASPAIPGEALSMYTINLIEGGVIPPQVTIGGRLAEVLYFGASDYPGYNQVNFRVPNGVAPGPAVSVRLTYLGRSSNAVTISVQ